jgi:hypothetical protein
VTTSVKTKRTGATKTDPVATKNLKVSSHVRKDHTEIVIPDLIGGAMVSPHGILTGAT